jgi:hypothetical protein
MLYILSFILSFFSIFFKSFAQQNVQYRRKKMIIPTSLILAYMELFTIGLFVNNFMTESLKSSIMLALLIGIGGGLGSIVSLDVHKWLSNKIYKWGEDK